MLSLQLKSGEYLTIGDDIAVQIFKQSGSVFRVEVKAPREVPILRGAVREKGGADRPGGGTAHRTRRSLPSGGSSGPPSGRGGPGSWRPWRPSWTAWTPPETRRQWGRGFGSSAHVWRPCAP